MAKQKIKIYKVKISNYINVVAANDLDVANAIKEHNIIKDGEYIDSIQCINKEKKLWRKKNS